MTMYMLNFNYILSKYLCDIDIFQLLFLLFIIIYLL